MKHIAQYIEGKTIGLGNAHPDDHIPQTHLLWAARHAGACVHEMVYTKGRNAGDNFRLPDEPWFSVARGDREAESRASAARMGIATYEQYDFGDGSVGRHERCLAALTAAWVKQKGIDILATLATGDHGDHDASVYIARRAAAMLLQTGYGIDLLELQPPGTGLPDCLQAEAAPGSIATAFAAAALNGSQFQIAAGSRAGWQAVPGGYSVEPLSLNRLQQYPIFVPAAYRYIPAGQETPAATGLIAADAP